jgi:hypothetical protein
MANFFDRLVQRAWQPETALQPRTLSRFEVPRTIGLMPLAPIESAASAASAADSLPAPVGGELSPATPTGLPTADRRERSDRVARRQPRPHHATDDVAGETGVEPIASAPASTVPSAPIGRRATRPRRARQVDPSEAVLPSFAPPDSTAEPGERVRRAAALVEPSRRVRPAPHSPTAGPSPDRDPAGRSVHVDGKTPIAPVAPSRDTALNRRDVLRVPPEQDHAPDRSPVRTDRPVRAFDRLLTAEPLEIAADSGGQTGPVIQVTIGRVEIRAVHAPRAEKRIAAKAPALSLDAYLTQRNGGGQ